jgi:hypothetical protein
MTRIATLMTVIPTPGDVAFELSPGIPLSTVVVMRSEMLR